MYQVYYTLAGIHLALIALKPPRITIMYVYPKRKYNK